MSRVVHRSQGWLPRIEGNSVWNNIPFGNSVFPNNFSLFVVLEWVSFVILGTNDFS